MEIYERSDWENTNDDVPLDQKLAEMYELIEGIPVAMLASSDAQGRLISRPMATQAHTGNADIWFMMSTETHKVEEIAISGTARLEHDRARIHEIYTPDCLTILQISLGPGMPFYAAIHVDQIETT